VTGICAAPITSARCRRVAAVVSEHDALDLAPTEQKLWEHESVLEALMEHGPVLPVRFGVTFERLEPLVRELDSRHDALAAALDGVRGRVELSVRVLERAPSLAGSRRNGSRSLGPGQHYLREKLERHRAADEIAGQLRQELLPLAVAERAGSSLRPGTLFATSYLVDSSRLGEFRARVAALHRRSDAVVCTGPWPPYNFVDVHR
jgi:hypothetical protein